MPADNASAATIERELNVKPMIARMLVQRGITTPEAAQRFLNPSLSDLPDPFLLPDAELACDRLKQALARKERILIHGDYDGDGVTSAALWTRLLRSLGADADVFVPHRKRDGYDIRNPAIEEAGRNGVKLIVTTDCGIRRIDEVEHARELGIDVLITDHHTPDSGGRLPKAVAVVNPHRSDSIYPFKDLAGVGVAFRLGEALSRTLGHNPANFRRAFLDLAAIGTVTDVMPLTDENRIIVAHGLPLIRDSRKAGIQALLSVSRLADKPIDAGSIGFSLGPRLNAAGRIDDAGDALNLLLTKDLSEAASLARKLDENNIERRRIQDQIFAEAGPQINEQIAAGARCIVVHGAGWSSSVVGIVASGIVEAWHRPSIVISIDESGGHSRGSARSIPQFHMLDAIAACGAYLAEYGGHSHAAGMSLSRANITPFAEAIQRVASERLTDDDLVPAIAVDEEIDPSDCTVDLLNEIARFAPFGNANPEPCFVSRSMRLVDRKTMGADGRHLKLFFAVEGPNDNSLIGSPWWRHGDMQETLASVESLDVCYRPAVNRWGDRTSVEFYIQDIRAPEW